MMSKRGAGTGTFTQNGGTVDIDDDVELGEAGGTGTLNVTAGSFEASRIQIGNSGGSSGFALLDGDVTANVTVFQNGGASTAELRGGGSITGNLTECGWPFRSRWDR